MVPSSLRLMCNGAGWVIFGDDWSCHPRTAQTNGCSNQTRVLSRSLCLKADQWQTNLDEVGSPSSLYNLFLSPVPQMDENDFGLLRVKWRRGLVLVPSNPSWTAYESSSYLFLLMGARHLQAHPFLGLNLLTCILARAPTGHLILRCITFEICKSASDSDYALSLAL